MISSKIDPQRIKCPANLVLIQAEPHFEHLKIDDELNLKMVDVYDPGFYVSVTGTVVSVPETLFFAEHIKNEMRRKTPGKIFAGHFLGKSQRITQKSVTYDTEIEVQVGDKVYFNFREHSCAEDEGREFYIEDKKYMFVRYDRLYLAVRDENIIPLNGVILAEPLNADVVDYHSISAIIALKETDLPSRGIIRHIGKPNGGYLGFRNKHDIDELKVGMEILFNRSMKVPLEYEVFSTLATPKKLFTLWRKDVLAINGEV